MAVKQKGRGIARRGGWTKMVVATATALLAVPLGMTPAASAGTTAPSGNITYFWWGDPIRNQLTDAVIKLYEKAHPAVKVQGEELAWFDLKRYIINRSKTAEFLNQVIYFYHSSIGE